MRIALCLLLLSGCVAPRHFLVVVPRSDDGMTCVRQCMLVQNGCSANTTLYDVTGNGWHALASQSACGRQQRTCLMTCPGAYEEEVPVQEPDKVAEYDHLKPKGAEF